MSTLYITRTFTRERTHPGEYRKQAILARSLSMTLMSWKRPVMHLVPFSYGLTTII